MLRKGSARGAPPEADKTADNGRSWAAMRARLRQGREPIFGAPAGEPPPAGKPAPATSPPGHSVGIGAPGQAGRPNIGAAEARPGAEDDPVEAVQEPAVSQGQRPAGRADRRLDRQATSEAQPPANGADHKGATAPIMAPKRRLPQSSLVLASAQVSKPGPTPRPVPASDG